MILKTRAGSNRELRMAGEWGYEHYIPRPYDGYLSRAGVIVGDQDVYGIPAVLNVISSAAEMISSLPFFVYRDGDVREAARDSWQWKLLHDYPSSECSAYDFFYDVALSLEATQNAFILKRKFRKEVAELEVLDPQRVHLHVDRATGEKRFDLYVDGSQVIRNLTADDVLHVRGFTPTPGGYCGVSLIQLERDALGNALAMQRFEGDYFRNNAQSPFVITGALNPDHAAGLGRAWNEAHAGVGNQWKAAALWGTLDVKTLPISMADAMFVDAKKIAIEDVCRIWKWPKEFCQLNVDQELSDEGAFMARFLKTSLYPRLRRIESAFANDKDLFRGQPLFGEFLTAALERADFVTRVRGYKDARQGGWVTANEIRKWENLPPQDGGDELQQTPVGGAPNDPAAPNEEPTND